MQFGLLCSAQADGRDPGAETGQGFRDYLEFNVEAEALGLHASFLVEHHFTGWNQVSATLMLLTALCLKFVPADPAYQRGNAMRLDVLGIVLLGGSILTGMVGVSYLGGAHAHATDLLFVLPVAVAAAGLLVFFWRNSRVRDPFIPPRLLLGNGAGAIHLVNFWFVGAVGGIGSLVSPALFALAADQIAYSAAFALFGLCALATAALLAFSVKETVGRGKLSVG